MGLLEIITVAVAIVIGLGLSSIVLLIVRSIRSRSLHPVLSRLLRFLGIIACTVLAVLLFLVFAGIMEPVAFLCPLLAVLPGPVVFIAFIILMFVLIEGTRKYRAARQYGLLWLLTVSAERFMPLVPAIKAFAQERRGSFSRRARRLAEMLEAGVSLPDALDRCPGLLPRYAAPTIRIGCETGTLAPALRQAATVNSLQEPIWMALQGKITYLLLLPTFGFLILAFVMLSIVPSFGKIFKDFGSTLPSLTVGLIGLANCTAEFWFLLIPLFLLGPALLFYLPIRYFGWTDFDLPGMGRFTRRLDSAQILDTLSLVAGQQQPLDKGITALARSYPKNNIRQRLLETALDVNSGDDWRESLCRHGLMTRPEAAILQAAQRVGNLPWALKELADSGRRRLAYRVQAIAQLLFPPIIIMMGLAVMFIVVALFLPLISLITKLA